jgi:hypothetical protein
LKYGKKMVFLVLPVAYSVLMLASCAMFTAWRAIPAPGGCEECHQVPISANWQVTYKPAMLSDERNRVYFQTEEYNKPQADKPMSSVDKRKVEELACFECHNAPDAAHKTMKGKFHH